VVLGKVPEALEARAEPDADVQGARAREALLDEREGFEDRDEGGSDAH
jgi:hypothetical protein